MSDIILCKNKGIPPFGVLESNFQSDIQMSDGDAIIQQFTAINIDVNSNTNINLPDDLQIELEFVAYIINGIQNLDVQFQTQEGAPSKAPLPMTFRYMPQFYEEGQINPILPPNEFPTNSNMSQTHNPNDLYYDPVDFKSYILCNQGLGYRPIKNKITFTIKKGSYTPLQIASEMNKGIASINGRNLQLLTNDDNNGLYISNNTSLFQVQKNEFPALTTMFCNGNNVFSLEQIGGNVDTTYVVGASQFAIDFDEDTQKFQWSFMHTPLYDLSGNTSAGLYQTYYNDAEYVNNVQPGYAIGPLFSQTRTSGIIFTDLKPLAFFRDQLGFDIDKTVAMIPDDTDCRTLNVETLMAFTTDALLPIDTIQQALAMPSYSGYPFLNTGSLYGEGNNIYNDVSPNLFAPSVAAWIQSQDVLPLIANNTYQTSNSGYLYIETNVYSDNILSSDSITNGLSSIISKFYLSNDFLTGFQDSSVVYIHKGDPITFSKIISVIRDSNGDIASNVKRNSAVFHRIVRANEGLVKIKRP